MMKIYNILTPINSEADYNEQSIFIEENFSFTAFLFHIFWLSYHKIWPAVISILIIQFSLFYASQLAIISDQTFHSLELVTSLIIAVFAKTWYIDSLKRKAYQLEAVIAAKNLDEAKLRYYQQLGE